MNLTIRRMSLGRYALLGGRAGVHRPHFVQPPLHVVPVEVHADGDPLPHNSRSPAGGGTGA